MMQKLRVDEPALPDHAARLLLFQAREHEHRARRRTGAELRALTP